MRVLVLNRVAGVGVGAVVRHYVSLGWQLLRNCLHEGPFGVFRVLLLDVYYRPTPMMIRRRRHILLLIIIILL